MFTTEVIPLVDNYIINDENLTEMTNYHQKQISYGRTYVSCNAQLSKPTYDSSLYQEMEILSGFGIDSKLCDCFISEFAVRCNPTAELLEVLSKLKERTPKEAAIVAVKHKGLIIASIVVIFDPRSFIEEEPVAYFIGIRKSIAFGSSQKILKRVPEHEVFEVKISSLILPKVEEYAKEKSAKYVATTPLLNMMKILGNYFGFSESVNIIKNRYKTPALIMTLSHETIYYKKV